MEIYSNFSFIREIYSRIKRTYSSFLNIAVFISSIFFILRLLAIPFIKEKTFDIDIFIISVSIVIILLCGEYLLSGGNKTFKKINDYLKILGSIIFLMLFINLFLGISNFLNQQFLSIWKNAELFLNFITFGLLFIITFFLIGLFFIGFVPFILSFVIKNKERMNEIMNKIGPSLLSLLFCSVVVVLDYLLISDFGASIYNKIGWVFYFSLLFLHSNYLIERLVSLFNLNNRF